MRLNNGLDSVTLTFPKEVTFIREYDINLDDQEYEKEVTHLIENEWDWCYTRYYMGSRGYKVKNEEQDSTK